MTDTTPAFDKGLARAEVRDLPIYNAGLSSAVVRERYGVARVARLASNENPFGPSPAVARALAGMAAVAEYPDPSSSELRAALAVRTGVAADRIVVGNGSENLIEILCQAFVAPGDGVVTVVPSFGLHEIGPRAMGGTVTLVPMTAGMAFDVDGIRGALGGAPKLLMISNPSNPVGALLDAARFQAVIDAAPAGTVLVIDEAYYEYAVRVPGFPDALSVLTNQARPWVVLRTFSKAWGLAGLRVGYALTSDAALATLLNRVRAPFNVNRAAQVAAVAALSDPAHMDHAVAETIARREAMATALRTLGLTVAPSAANFLFVNCGRPAGEVAETLLTRGVIVKPWKERGYEEWLRVSIGSDEDNAAFLEGVKPLGR